jgi:AcrR family transcriptional regulator
MRYITGEPLRGEQPPRSRHDATDPATAASRSPRRPAADRSATDHRDTALSITATGTADHGATGQNAAPDALLSRGGGFADMTRPTRERIVGEALRLFAERGYAATSVAEIEAASGLSPGAGGLYRHFRSKEEVLAAAVRGHVARTKDQISALLGGPAIRQKPLPERLDLVCRSGLAKMREEQDLIRVLFRDLDKFPYLVREIREGLVHPLFDAIADWLSEQREFSGSTADWPAVSSVLGGAIVNFWLTTEQLYEPPSRIDEERFVAGWTHLALGLASRPPGSPDLVGGSG